MDPVRQYTSQSVDEPTTIRIFPGADGAFTLYDDDGYSMGYRDATDTSIIWIHFQWNDATKSLTIYPDPRMKTWPNGTRIFNIKLAGNTNPTKVEFKGQPVEIALQSH